LWREVADPDKKVAHFRKKWWICEKVLGNHYRFPKSANSLIILHNKMGWCAWVRMGRSQVYYGLDISLAKSGKHSKN
jgi:hypothetical protein